MAKVTVAKVTGEPALFIQSITEVNLMSTEVLMLVLAVGFILLLAMIQGSRYVVALGLVTVSRNHNEPSAAGLWRGRLDGAISQQIKAVALFSPLLITVEVANLTNHTTALGAEIFLVASVVFALTHTVTVAWGRWLPGIGVAVGIALVAWPLIRLVW